MITRYYLNERGGWIALDYLTNTGYLHVAPSKYYYPT